MPNTEAEKFVHVVAAVIEQHDKFLVAKRKKHAHQGGLWEFPGGKVNQGEQPFQALQRELGEELAIEVDKASPYLKVHHQYKDLSVYLDIYHVKHFVGDAKGNEGQAIRWVSSGELKDLEFPEANRKIVKALFAPSQLAISPESMGESYPVKERILQARALGCDAILLRLPNLDDAAYEKRLMEFRELINAQGLSGKLRLIVNRTEVLGSGLADGLHLNSVDLMTCSSLDVPEGLSVSASCHSPEELQQAERLDMDFALLSPVGDSKTHPASKLGWQRASDIARTSALPVLFLGGMKPEDKEKAKANDAFGIAGIRDFGLQDQT